MRLDVKYFDMVMNSLVLALFFAPFFFLAFCILNQDGQLCRLKVWGLLLALDCRVIGVSHKTSDSVYPM